MTETGNLKDPIEISLKKFANHLSILSMNEYIDVKQHFPFSEITSENVLSEIQLQEVRIFPIN